MSTESAQQKQLPHYVYLNERNQEYYTRVTLEGKYRLLPSEVFWRERQRFLHDNGYALRPRYSQDWRPSWLGTNLHPIYCEDSIVLIEYQVMDARRMKEQDLVAIKTFRKDSQELRIAQFLSSLRDPQNHTVPILQVLDDPHDLRRSLMVMPFLRPIHDPDFMTVGEVIDFVGQMLEGLVFMHRHRIAHRDIAVPNIMVDANSLYPDGYHPVRLDHSPDTIHPVTPLPRTGRKLQYYYIDFGLACQVVPGSSSYTTGDVGRDVQVPELSSSVPYDPFKVDIYSLGNVYSHELEERFNNLQFLKPLIDTMRHQEPQSRPTADEVLSQWQGIRDSLSKNSYQWRLTLQSHSAVGRMLSETVAVAWEGMSNLTKYVI